MKDTFKFHYLLLTAITGIGILSIWAMLSYEWCVRKDYRIKIYRKLNPNKAAALSLSRLPSLGITRAEAVVKYRSENSKDGKSAFDCISDLRMVKGIGSKTEKVIEKWLVFE